MVCCREGGLGFGGGGLRGLVGFWLVAFGGLGRRSRSKLG
jgi:hypothetical protein